MSQFSILATANLAIFCWYISYHLHTI